MYVVRLQNCEGLLSGDIRGFVLPTSAATVAFLKLDDGVARNGCRFNLEIKLFPQILHVEPHFVRKNCPGGLQTAILLQFAHWTSFRSKRLRFGTRSLTLPPPKRELHK